MIIIPNRKHLVSSSSLSQPSRIAQVPLLLLSLLLCAPKSIQSFTFCSFSSSSIPANCYSSFHRFSKQQRLSCNKTYINSYKFSTSTSSLNNSDNSDNSDNGDNTKTNEIMSETQEPKPKRAKIEEKTEVERVKEEEEQEEDDGDKVEILKNDNNESYFDLSTKKRVTVRKWKNNVLIDIREVRIFLLEHMNMFVSHSICYSYTDSIHSFFSLSLFHIVTHTTTTF